MTTKDNDRNVYIAPDYSMIAKHQTNGAIIEAFIPYLFSKKSLFNKNTVLVILRNITLLLLIKTILEESKYYLDSFKFTDLNYIKYFIQKLKFSETKYNIIFVNNKWTYQDKTLSNSLVLFFETKMIYITQPKTYYYKQGVYLVKVIVNEKNIVICVPNNSSIMLYINNEVINSNIDNIYGKNTKLYRIIAHTMGIQKLECMKESHAFSTTNYKNLCKSIKNYFLVDSCIRSQNVACYNFDGEPGTGKTTFGYYIARKDIFTRVVICNLIQLTKKDFKETIKNLENLIVSKGGHNSINIEENEKVLLIIDEMDKWLESYLQEITLSNREELQNKNINTSDKNNQTQNCGIQKLNKKEEIDKKNQLKETFFDQLFALTDGLLLSNNAHYVIIFNTNNFDSIFDDCSNRYIALKDRFKKFTFNKNSKLEIITYFDKFIKYMIKSKKINFECDLYSKFLEFDKSYYCNIPDDIQISYRTLMDIMQSCSYDIKLVIDQLCFHNKKP